MKLLILASILFVKTIGNNTSPPSTEDRISSSEVSTSEVEVAVMSTTTEVASKAQQNKNTTKENSEPPCNCTKHTHSKKKQHSHSSPASSYGGNLHNICPNSSVIYVFYAIALPFTCEMLMMILCYFIRDWDKFLHYKSILLSFALMMFSFLFAWFNLRVEDKDEDIWIILPPFIYFTILYEYAWTSISASDAFFKRLIASQTIVSNGNEVRVQNVCMLAIELYSCQIGFISVAYLFSLFNNFTLPGSYCDGSFETELNAKIPLSYFSNSTLIIVTCCVLLLVTTSRKKTNDAERMLFSKFLLFAVSTICFTFAWLFCLVAINGHFWIMWIIMQVVLFFVGLFILILTNYVAWRKTSFKLLLMKRSKKCALVKFQHIKGKEHLEKVKLYPIDKVELLTHA